MFITVKRHEREKQELLDASNRLTDAILGSVEQGLFLLDRKEKIFPRVSKSVEMLFRRQDFSNVTFDRLITPLVTAKVLSAARSYLASLRDAAAHGAESAANPLQDVEVRLIDSRGATESAHYSFEFTAVDVPREPRMWLVRVSDITARAQQTRELEDLRIHAQIHRDILRSLLNAGGVQFAAFMQRTDASMKTINGVLKKPAREADAFRQKLEETLGEVDRVRRDALTFKFNALESAARGLEDALQELGTRGTLSGSDFLPLAVKLDQLYGQFVLIRQLLSQAGNTKEGDDNATLVIAAPKFPDLSPQSAVPEQSPARTKPLAQSKAPQTKASAGSLESTLIALTELVAQEQQRTVILECTGLQDVPVRYQATVKNITIQLIRNAVMHGIENAADRKRAGKPLHGTLYLEFKAMQDNTFELHFQDDGRGLDPQTVRGAAIACGLITADAAARLRDRQAIKLIFKSGFTTLAAAPGASHGQGMSLVRRYVNQAGGKIALASLLGHETRFKVTLPAVAPLTRDDAAPAPRAQVA